MDTKSKSEPDPIQSDVVDLIAKHRLLRMVEGGRFLKYSPKGQRIKDKLWICKLSPNHRTLHYGDLNDNRDPPIDELPNRINISDVKRILVGKDCPHTRDGQLKKASIDLAFSIVHESDYSDHLNFVPIDNKTFCYWTDGLNALLKNNMQSDEFLKDLNMLSKVEHRIRSISKAG